jgi:hypothetical protein
MNGAWILAGGVAFGLPMIVGCDGSSSAREPAAVSEASFASGRKAAPTAELAAAENAAAPSGYLEATFDDIKFPMEKTQKFERSMLTPKAKSLFDKRIRIRGYMFPTLRKQGLTQFVLVRDNLECCFGPGAALYDCIVVNMAPGKTAEYSIRPVAVEGQFRLDEMLGPDGRALAIYQMVGEGVN